MTHTAQDDAKVLIEVAIAAPAETVWQALRDPTLIDTWFGWDADSLAEEIKYIFIDNVVEDAAAKTLRFNGIADRFEVKSQGAGSVIQLLRDGAAGDDSDWDGPNEAMTEGWSAFMHQLRFALERHPGERRRTIYLVGAAREGAAASARQAVLDDPAKLGPDQRSAGETWMTTRRQTALAVEAYGDGLVLIADASAGGGWVIVTTYGLDDEAFSAIESSWTEWWANHFKPAAPPSSS